MAVEADSSRTSEPDIAELGRRFSASVRGVASRYPQEEVTAWQIADMLIEGHRYGGQALLPLADRDGERAPVGQWMLRVASLFDQDAVARSDSEVIDGRLMLLALCRIDPALDELFRRSRFRSHLRRGLGYAAEDVFLPWVLPPPYTEFVEVLSVTHDRVPIHEASFSSGGRLLATNSGQTFRLWDVPSGEELRAFRRDVFTRVALSADGRFLAGVDGDRMVRLLSVASEGELRVLGAVGAPVFSPDSRLVAATAAGGSVQLWDAASGSELRTLQGHGSPLRTPAFSPAGDLFCAVAADGTVQVWDLASGAVRHVLRSDEGEIGPPVFSADGRLLAVPAGETALVWDVASGVERHVLRGHRVPVSVPLAFSPDGRLLAVTSMDGVQLWDLSLGAVRDVLRNGAGGPAFSGDGRLLLTATSGGAALWDVASGTERQALPHHDSSLFAPVFSPGGGPVATIGVDALRVWEEIEPPGALPRISPDAIGDLRRRDLLGIGGDVGALANLIAAEATAPPLSIGLFGDWGSGKSFLIKEVQERVGVVTRRSRQAGTSAYCFHIRNIEFNAWHYADANLWASLVTHIFDELAEPVPDAGIDATKAKEQLARLEEELAASSAARQRLERAQVQSWRLDARRQLRRLTWGAAGALKDDERLAQLGDDVQDVRGKLRVLIPNARAWIVTVGLALLVAAAIAGVLVGVGVERVWAAVIGAAAWVGALLGWLQLGAHRVRTLVARAGEAVQAKELKSGDIDVRLEAARARERELRQEIADLASGRRMGEFVAERSASRDYRAQLGVVSQIHRDFDQLARLLGMASETRKREQLASAAKTQQEQEQPTTRRRVDRLRKLLERVTTRRDRASTQSQPEERAPESDLPPIDRIVLYIDDLDRCPPRRVVEVLEAVHLILALPLFVVVLAVDPRWLQQSLSLHYAELLAATAADEAGGPRVAAPAGDGRHAASGVVTSDALDDTDPEWRPTPLNYLEKIIQVPFTLRPMTQRGARTLVRGLLPLEARDAERAAGVQEGGQGTPPGARGRLPPGDVPAAEAPSESPRERAQPVQAPPPPAPSLSPRTLALTVDERDRAADVAGILRTPRAVKKFTNLYRLFRAGLDEPSGRLDRFLEVGDTDIPEYQAVLVLLAVIIAFPEEAPDLLLGLGDLDPDAEPSEVSWMTHLDAVGRQAPVGADPRRWNDLHRFLRASSEKLTNSKKSSVEPFRRWGLETSRYSFSTGLRVFARSGAAPATEGPPPASTRKP